LNIGQNPSIDEPILTFCDKTISSKYPKISKKNSEIGGRKILSYNTLQK
jgi:hypothetical protein